MTDQAQLGIGWYINETVKASVPYGLGEGSSASIPVVASNVATFNPNEDLAAGRTTGIPTTLANGLGLLVSIKSDSIAGGDGTKSQFMAPPLSASDKYYFEVSGSGWKLRVETSGGSLIGNSSTVFAWSAAPSLSWLRSSSRLRVWMNGTKEIDVSGLSGTVGDSLGNIGVGTNPSKFYVGQILCMSTSVADRYMDASGFASAQIIGASAGKDSDFSGVTPVSTNPWADVDDWDAGGPSDDATTEIFNAGVASTTYRHYFNTATPTCANPVLVMVYCRVRPNVASKTSTFYNGICDNTVYSEVLTAIFTSNTWASYGSVFPNAPDGTPWDSGDLAPLQIGIKNVVGSLFDVGEITALEAEVFGVTFLSDAAGAAVDRRRAAAGFV